MSSDAHRIWREGAGQTKQRTVRSIWPQLADALDGPTADALDVPDQPLCDSCGRSSGKLAMGRSGSLAVCGTCAGMGEFREKFQRVMGWKPGHQKGWRPSS
jgi:DnaJ-class molecular chaperone